MTEHDFPRTNWAVWDEDGNLAISRRFDEPVTSTEALEAFGRLVPLGVPTRMVEPFTIAEFTDERGGRCRRRSSRARRPTRTRGVVNEQ